MPSGIKSPAEATCSGARERVKPTGSGRPLPKAGTSRREYTPIPVDPRDDDRLLVAVSTAGILGTRDGGKSWVDLRRGLPRENDCDLVYGHALDN